MPQKSFRRLMFHCNLLGVPEPFPSFSSTPPPAQSSLQTGVGTTCADPRGGMLSGHMAEKTTFTGYEPNSLINVSSEHTPINFPFRSNSFNREDDLANTIAASEDFDHFPQPAAACGCQHSAASTVPALLNLGSQSCTRKLVRYYEFVPSSFSRRCMC